MSIALDLPDEHELAAESQANAADAAELELAEDAAAAVEEGDEQESVEEAAEEPSLIEFLEQEFNGEDAAIASDDPEATLLEEPTDEGQTDTPPTLAAQSPARPLTPHQPPKSAALVAYEHRRAEARDRYEGTMYEWRKLEAAAKAAKERWKDAEDALYDVLNEGGDFEEEVAEVRPVASVESSPFPSAAAVVEEAGDSSAPTEAESPQPVADPNAWRRVPISELHLENLKGLGAKKIEQITLACPTIGHLEDLRAGFDGLKALGGIGQAKADAIEEAILNWLSKNRDAEVMAAVRAGGSSLFAFKTPAASDQEITPELAAQIAQAKTEIVEKEDGDELPSIQDMIAARAQAIFFRTGDLSSVSPDDCLSQQIEDGRYFDGGWESCNAGNELIDCPIDPAGPERDDWLRGWMSAKLTNEEGWQGPGAEN